MSQPFVSVICLCYNHARFVEEAIQSVRNQTYQHVQLIIVDDASEDDSAAVISKAIGENSSITFIQQKSNVGNCKAFNIGLAAAKGEFIIDFAADDILMPDRIEKGISFFQQSTAETGVNFTDAEWINETGEHLYFHSDRFPHDQVPQGDVYIHLIEKYFICSPTMMFRRSVMESLGGYDETLAYEDFDFWIRSSRKFKYGYSPFVSVKKRVVKNSMSKNQFKTSKQQWSTFEVCKKIITLNKDQEEKKALRRRLIYEAGVNIRLFNFDLVISYLQLWFKI